MPNLNASHKLKYHIIYQITNEINGSIYIGAHSTNDLDDDYMGSGKLLKLALKKYGIENFSKKVLHIYNTPKEMYEKEANIVTEDFVSRRDVYNIVTGGFGGFNRGSSGLRHITNIITGETIAVDHNKVGQFLSEEWILGGKEPSNKGKIYVHKDSDRKAINKEDLDIYLANGWSKGYAKSHTVGKVWVYHPENDKYSLCDKSELDYYLANGWVKKKWSPLKPNTIWINNGQERKRITVMDAQTFLDNGWRRGRNFKPAS